MVRMPIATSIKKVANPVTLMDFSMENNPHGRSNRSVFFLLPKCVSIIRREKTDPITVASPAPIIPRSMTNTKK